MHKLYLFLIIILIIVGKQSTAQFNLVDKIVASDRAADDEFGNSVSISGNYAIVGVPREDEDALGLNTMVNSGAAYIYWFNGTNWVEQQKIVASDRTTYDEFGWSVSISGNYAIVGARYESEDALGLNNMVYSGAAYIYWFNGTNWVEQQKIVASDRATGDYFGHSVSISGNYAIVGVFREDEDALGLNNMSSSGAAYIYWFNGTNWVEQQKIVASDRATVDYFGWSVSISGNYAIVGARYEDEDALGLNTMADAGAAYIYWFNGTNWVEQQKIVASDRATGDYFGHSVSISGNYAIVSAPSESEDALGLGIWVYSGAAYIYWFNGTNWVEQQKIVASDRATVDYFGHSVSISGNYAIVGVRYEDEDALGLNTILNTGSAYIYWFNGTNWVEQQKIVASDRAADDEFGHSVSISGNYAIVSALLEDEDALGLNTMEDAGSAYIFSGLIMNEITNYHLNDLIMSVYPNPAENELNIKLDEIHKEVNVSVYNLYGQEVLQRKYSNNRILKLDISMLPKGFYLLQAKNDDARFSASFIKQ